MKARTITIGKATPDPLDRAAQALAAAVLVHSVREAWAGTSEAAYWMHTSGAVFYARLAGYEDTTTTLVKIAKTCRPRIRCEPRARR